MRFLKEFFNPSLKCERLGHDEYIEEADITFILRRFRAVAEEYECTRNKCRRCAVVFTEWKRGKYLGSIQSISMPSDMMKRFEKRGWKY